jgi:hypothetical protein
MSTNQELKEKFFQLSYNEKLLDVNTFTFMKILTDGLKSYNFTDEDEIHLYICREPHQMMVQNVEKKFDLYEEKNYKIGVFKMSNIFSELPNQQVFFMKNILPKIKELRAALTKDANS